MSKNTKVLEFLIFHRNGTCLCDLDNFDENNKMNITNKVFTASANKENEHRYKLIYGMLFSMKSFVKTLSPLKAKENHFQLLIINCIILNFSMALDLFLLQPRLTQQLWNVMKNLEIFINIFILL